ncbi:CDP-glycerol glycerophosphotransferase family protein [Marinobacter sp. NFXS9]|uniref:CDP-glycerol glycerophosphotransferase family protein n=1 Tax=Marinobacter sp. NFXS9 TaxID=2818433 RepID=UPI0032DF7F6A
MEEQKPVKVLLLLQRPEAWVNFASLWHCLSAHKDIEPTLWVLPYNYESHEQSAIKKPLIRKLLSNSSIPYHEWSEGEYISSNQFDFVIFNHPYDRERPSSLWVDKVKQVVPRIIYIPYGLVMGGGYKNMRLQFGQSTQVLASAVIARSVHEKKLYSRYCPVGSGNVYVLGQPRFDQVIKEMARPVPKLYEEAAAGRLCILWNSHFSFGRIHSQSSNFSTFDLLGPEIIELALAMREQLCLLWRPHPGLFPAIVREGLLYESDIPILRSELADVGIILDENPDHLAAFKLSDALLTDVGSFLLEYLVTGRPILSLLNPEGEPLNPESRKLIEYYDRASDPSDVKRFIERLLSRENNALGLKQARSQHLPLLDGRSSERVVALMLALHSGEDAGVLSDPSTEADMVLVDKSFDIPAVGNQCEQVVEEDKEDIEMPPTLARLLSGLRALRDFKKNESVWKKRGRRVVNQARIFSVERVKRSLLLMRIMRNFR